MVGDVIVTMTCHHFLIPHYCLSVLSTVNHYSFFSLLPPSAWPRLILLPHLKSFHLYPEGKIIPKGNLPFFLYKTQLHWLYTQNSLYRIFFYYFLLSELRIKGILGKEKVRTIYFQMEFRSKVSEAFLKVSNISFSIIACISVDCREKKKRKTQPKKTQPQTVANYQR